MAVLGGCRAVACPWSPSSLADRRLPLARGRFSFLCVFPLLLPLSFLSLPCVFPIWSLPVSLRLMMSGPSALSIRSVPAVAILLCVPPSALRPPSKFAGVVLTVLQHGHFDCAEGIGYLSAPGSCARLLQLPEQREHQQTERAGEHDEPDCQC